MSPRNASEDRFGIRTYAWREEKYHSATSILNAIGKPWLAPWQGKTVAQYAVSNVERLRMLLEPDANGYIDEAAAVDWLKGSPFRDVERAQGIGTEIHKAIEAYVLGKPFPSVPVHLNTRMDSFHEFLKKYEPDFQFGMAEASVYNRAQRYAGTLDALGTIDGRPLLFDWKTGKDIYPEVALQLSAYRHAEFIGMPDGSEFPMPQVDGGVCLHLPASGDWRLEEVDCGEDIFTMFQFVREVYRWSQVVSKNVLMGEYDRAKHAQPSLLEVIE